MNKKTVRKILSLVLIFSLVFGMIPATGFASEEDMVYISVSYDETYIIGANNKPIAYVGVPLDTVASVDLESYGLSDYLYDADGDGTYETTALHLIIWAHENLYGGDWSDVIFTGAAGSSYFQGGVFGFDENLNYYLNGEYPLESEGWGATSDHIVLKPGDFIDMGSFSSWDFYQDSNYGFHYFIDEEGNITHNYTAEAGKDLDIHLIRSYSGMGSGAMTFDEGYYDIYYGSSYGDNMGTATTDDSGYATINIDEAGTYYLWADGGYGMEFPESVVSAPAFTKITVTEPEGPTIDEAVENVIAKINSIGTVTLDSETNINEARTAYDALTDSQKEAVTNYVDLTAAETKLSQLKANKEAADEVIAKIASIGEVTLDSSIAISEARASYDILTDEQKGLVNNYEVLTNAEARLDELVEEADKREQDKAVADSVAGNILAIGEVTLEKESMIVAARTAYDSLTEAQKELIENYNMLEAAETQLSKLKADKAIADIITAQIDAIGEVTLESEAEIRNVREAYDALSEGQKSFVTKISLIEDAEKELKRLQDEKTAEDKNAAADVDSAIEAIGDVSIYNVSKVLNARDAYDALTKEQKAYVVNLETLTKAEEALVKLYEEASNINHKEIYDDTAKYLQTLGTPIVNSIGGEWMVIDLTRAGLDCQEGYYENVEEYVKANINDKEQLHRSKGTDNSRVILALTSAGYDVTDVAGHNLLKGLSDMNYVKKQGINGPIWALIALDSHDYEIPKNDDPSAQVTREGLIEYILDKRVDDGGWNLMLASEVCDPDMTGMAIQALAPYYNSNAEVKAAVDGALETLSKIQHENGGYSSMEGSCSESCAQVIVALTSLGINPETDPRFTKNGVSVVDAMCLFAVEGGGFTHVPNGTLNGMATEQGQYALAAYYRFLNGQTSLYDMSDVQVRKVETLPTIDVNKPAEDVEIGTSDESKDVLAETSKEILDLINDNTETKVKVETVVKDAIKKAIDEGKRVTVSSSIIIEKVDIADAEKFFGKEHIELIKKESGNATVVQYLDLNVLMTVNADGVDIAQGKVSELKDEIEFTVAIPEKLKQVKEGFEREFFVIRVHGTEVTRLNTTLNSDGTVSFYTGLFSTYALAYEDIAKDTDTVKPEEPSDDKTPEINEEGSEKDTVAENSTEVEVKKEETPKTGDTNNMLPWAMVMTMALVVMVVTKRKES